MHRGRPMGESFDHRPAGWIRQSRKCCTQLIHNRMVVDYSSLSSVDFAVPDFCFLISEPILPLVIPNEVRDLLFSALQRLGAPSSVFEGGWRRRGSLGFKLDSLEGGGENTGGS